METDEMSVFAIGLAAFLAVLLALSWVAAPAFERQLFPPNPFASEQTPPPTTAPQTRDD